MSVHKKLMAARVKLQSVDMKKSGQNKFAGYSYFELGDFIPHVQTIFNELGLCGVVSFDSTYASKSEGRTPHTKPGRRFELPTSLPLDGSHGAGGGGCH